jgi:hypothetical protein
VGLLQKNPEGKFSFSYNKDAIKDALEEGFTPYTEFPRIEDRYNGNVLDIFGQRLIKPERPDIQTFYNFWEIDPQHKEDKFYLLGHTQGLLPTDNFEFLADYNVVDGLHFLTEVAALSINKLPSNILTVGDTLRFEVDKKNEDDPDAIKIFKNKDEIGYVKKIHCRVFHKPGNEKLRLSVKAIDKNGTLKKVFVKVSL